MIVKRGEGDFDRVYRPSNFNEVKGQEVASAIVKNALEKNKVSHAYLFFGPSGTGKTTIARILALGLNCKGREESPTSNPCGECDPCKSILSQSSPDYLEINVADKTKVDDARDLISNLSYSTLDLKKRVIVLDEVQQMTDKAQNVLLKPVEAKRDHVYFVLCTTDPRKVILTLRKRFSKVEFKNLKKPELVELLNEICVYEGAVPDAGALRLIADEKDSARECVVALQDILTAEKLGDINWVRSYLDKLTEKEEAELRELAYKVIKGDWRETSSVAKKLLESYDGETVRRFMAGYFAGCLLSPKTTQKSGEKFYRILTHFKTPFYSNKPKAELVQALFGATSGKVRNEPV